MSEEINNTSNMPKHTNVKLVNIYGEELEGVIIPLSIKSTMYIEDNLNIIKSKLTANIDEQIADKKKKFELESPTDEDIDKEYVESKITMELLGLNEEVTDDKVKSLIKKKGAKLLDGKSIDFKLDELCKMAVDSEMRKKLLLESVSLTLWSVLRKKDNLRENLFADPNVLIDEIDEDILVNLFKNNTSDPVMDEDELKN